MTALERHEYSPPTRIEHRGPEPSWEPVSIDPTGGRLVAWATAARAANALAESLCKTSFVPKEFRGKPEDTTAAILLGDELGLSPLAALKSVYVVHGTPSIYARTMVALVQSNGHEVWTDTSTDREVTVSGQRRGSSHVETATWTIDRARKAGYTSNNKYATNPQEMLWAKAASEVCRKVASDVLAGVPYSVEDLELEPENQPTTPVKRASTRVQRQRQEAPAPPEPDFDVPKVSTPPVDSGQPDEPEPAPDLITKPQLAKLHASLGDAGLSDREQGLAYISQVIGRDIDTSKALTKAEASQVIEALNPEPAEPPLDGLQ